MGSSHRTTFCGEFQDRVKATVYGPADGDDVVGRDDLLMTTKAVRGKQWVKGIDDDGTLERAMELGARYGSGSFLGQPARLELAKKIRVAWAGS